MLNQIWQLFKLNLNMHNKLIFQIDFQLFFTLLNKLNQTTYFFSFFVLVLKPYSFIHFFWLFLPKIFIDIYSYSYSIYYLYKFFCVSRIYISELTKHDKHWLCQSFLRAHVLSHQPCVVYVDFILIKSIIQKHYL